MTGVTEGFFGPRPEWNEEGRRGPRNWPDSGLRRRVIQSETERCEEGGSLWREGMKKGPYLLPGSVALRDHLVSL